MMERIDIHCGEIGMSSTCTIDGIDPGDELRGEAINANVSAISAIPQVRDRLVDLQRHYLEHTSVIMEGRDIGSVVFPDTPFKIYVDASEAVRAASRRNDGEIDSVAKRDAADSERSVAPLIIAAGAVVLDTSDHSIESGVDAAIEILKQQGLPALKAPSL
jgi:cytidylate kinase